MQMYAIFTDLDGTISFLTDGPDDSQVSYMKEHDQAALTALRDSGHTLSVATGRDIPGIQTFVDLANFEFDYYIGGNGAIITDKDLNIVSRDAFSHDELLDLIQFLLKEFPDFYVTGYDGFVTYAINHTGKHPIFSIDPEVFQTISFDDFSKNPIEFIALDMFPKTGDTAEMVLQAQNALAIIAPLYDATVNMFRNQFYVDFAPMGISKGSAVTKISEQILKHPHEVVAIGDSWNDVSMFEIADHAYTFTHADDALHAKADYVVTSFAEMADNIQK